MNIKEEDYLENPNHCPVCHSHDISGLEIELGDGGTYQVIRCNECQSEWNDIYTLTSIEMVYNSENEILET